MLRGNIILMMHHFLQLLCSIKILRAIKHLVHIVKAFMTNKLILGYLLRLPALKMAQVVQQQV